MVLSPETREHRPLAALIKNIFHDNRVFLNGDSVISIHMSYLVWEGDNLGLKPVFSTLVKNEHQNQN